MTAQITKINSDEKLKQDVEITACISLPKVLIEKIRLLQLQTAYLPTLDSTKIILSLLSLRGSDLKLSELSKTLTLDTFANSKPQNMAPCASEILSALDTPNILPEEVCKT